MAIATRCLKNLDEIKIFRAATKRYLGKTTIFRTTTGKNLNKIKNFRAAARIIWTTQIFCLSKMTLNAGKSIKFKVKTFPFREHHVFETKIKNQWQI